MKCIKKPTCISKQPTWWDKECEVAKSRKNRALNTYRNSIRNYRRSFYS